MSLSYDNLLEIFSRLPAKVIYKFTSTCVSLSKLPKEAYFALNQAQHALLRDDTCFFIQPEIPIAATQWCNLPVEFHPLPGEESSSGVSKNALAYFSKSVKILCSSNGLVLCSVASENEVKFFISNPATQSSSPIPTSEHLQNSNNFYDHNIGFVCDFDGNFLMYHFIDNLVEWSSYFDCKVYSSKEGVWKEKERFSTGSRNLRFESPVHYRGAVHFISDCSTYLTRDNPYFRPYIMSYRFEDGKSRMWRVPKVARKCSHDKSCDMRIFKWGKAIGSYQSICLVRLQKKVFTIWVLREYESSLWRQNLKIRVRAMKGLENDSSNIQVKDFVVLNGELLVFATQNKVYAYGLRDRRIHKSWDHECDFNVVRITSYMDTLRTCDI
ncbi:F-box protein At5g49610-like [Vigna unguiculata]|uniref:F-box protein At5g49610-like n=1 Tax=Vigna unguiculata TaxID=3917 RepID=UPI001015E1CB|nr:F-box protein At5g49610-like [Vigna unguiculata]